MREHVIRDVEVALLPDLFVEAADDLLVGVSRHAWSLAPFGTSV
jgi:hypothetical protein